MKPEWFLVVFVALRNPCWWAASFCVAYFTSTASMICVANVEFVGDWRAATSAFSLEQMEPPAIRGLMSDD